MKYDMVRRPNALVRAWRGTKAALAIGGTALSMIVLTPVVLLLSPLPLYVRGVRLAAWPVTWMCRVYVLLFGLHLDAPEADRIRQHRGLLFVNHLSFLDIIVLLALWPMRFVAKTKVRRYFLVGHLAASLDCVFVDRESKASREQARRQAVGSLTEQNYPPLVIFPEGTRGPGNALLPFRRGAFQLAVQAQQPYLPCAIQYEPLGLVHAPRTKAMWSVIWEMGAYPGPIAVRFLPAEPVLPAPEADVDALAGEAQHTLGRALGFGTKQKT